MPQRPESFDETRLFFAGGQGKSGTTWVQLLLDAHPEVVCRGEAHFFDLLAPSLHEAFVRYRGGLDANNRLFPELAGFPLPGENEAMAALRAAIVSALQGQIDKEAPRAIGERTPANFDRLPLIWRLFPRSRFVHVVRDPRDVAVSLWHHGKRIGSGNDERFQDLDALAVDLCTAWAAGLERSDEFRRSNPDGFIELRYEDLLENGESSLAKLLTFLDVSTDSTTIRKCLDACAFERLTGGRQRGDEDAASHFRKGVSGDWRGQLSDAARRRIAEAAAAQFERLGYAPD